MFNLPKLLAKTYLTARIPTGTYWFDKAKLNDTTTDIGRLIEGISIEIAEWFEAIRKDAFRDSILKKAVGTALDEWGADLQMPRDEAEADSSYRNRMSAEIVRGRNTKPNIIAYLELSTGLDFDVFLPWTYLDWRDRRSTGLNPNDPDPFYGRSGRAVRSSEFYQAGVIEITSYGYNRRTRDLAYQVSSAGVKIYFKPILQTYVAAPTVINYAQIIKNTQIFIAEDILIINYQLSQQMQQVIDYNNKAFDWYSSQAFKDLHLYDTYDQWGEPETWGNGDYWLSYDEMFSWIDYTTGHSIQCPAKMTYLLLDSWNDGELWDNGDYWPQEPAYYDDRWDTAETWGNGIWANP